MRVLLACEFATLHGGERSLLAVLPRLSAMGFQFHAYAPPSGPLAQAFAELSIAVIPSRDARGIDKPSLDERRQHLADAILAGGYDLVHANSLNMGRTLGPVAAGALLPSVAHVRDMMRLSAAAVVDLNRNTRLVAVSSAARDWHVAQGVDPLRMRVVYNGVDAACVAPRAPSGWLREAIGAPAGALVIGSIGQIVRRKGLDVLARAAARLADRWPHVHWVIVGERYSEKVEAVEFERSVRTAFDHACGERSHFLGDRDDVDAILPELDLLVHSARQEPLGRVLLEAAAAAVPIVATNVGGTAEIFPDEARAALLVPHGDDAALAEAIDRLLAAATLRARLGAAARQRVERAFTVERSAERLAELNMSAL